MATYINKISLKKKQFGTQFTGLSKDFIAQIQENTNEKGYFNFEIKERKEPSEKGETHYIVVNEWKPKQ
jgi:glycerophosphoryl diester phosphodiesterase